MEKESIFELLNAPFPYHEYQYDSFGDRCYITGQAVAERLNEVLGIGFWKYRGLYETERIVQDQNSKNPRLKIYVEFSLYNSDLGEWITFLDVGSEQVKSGMNEGDATKSAITDGMKKCASRIGVASDLYKGLISWDKQHQLIIVPNHYFNYYDEMGWNYTTPRTLSKQGSNRNSTAKPKTELTEQLKKRSTSIQTKIKLIWKELAGSMDGLEEWYQKKKQENVSDQQMYNLLRRKLEEKVVSA